MIYWFVVFILKKYFGSFYFIGIKEINFNFTGMFYFTIIFLVIEIIK